MLNTLQTYLNTLEVLISKALIEPNISHNEFFFQ